MLEVTQAALNCSRSVIRCSDTILTDRVEKASILVEGQALRVEIEQQPENDTKEFYQMCANNEQARATLMSSTISLEVSASALALSASLVGEESEDA